MLKVMLVNVTHVEESRVAIVADGVLDAYDIETLNRAQLRGNIYNAVVESIHPALEAAFLWIAPDLKGFLPLDEVNFALLPDRGDARKAAGKIGRHLHAGQRLMVQIVREPFAGKPPTVSTYFSLPGRHLVLLPGVDSSGVSRKIDDSEQRDRLKKIVDELAVPEGFGAIVRTAGLGQTKLELQRDLRYLLRLWQSVQRSSRATEFPGLIYREADLVTRTMRDHLSSDISEVWIDSKETHDKALEFVRDVMPTRAKTLRLYTGDRPLFNRFNLEEQIESIYKRRVQLPSGGEIVIDGTEALTAIDVNSARSKRSADAEANATETNVEAAAEIARQLRLRDLGGLIVIDFIDMSVMRNKKRVEDGMRDAMRTDRAKHDLTRISKLGLMEIARQRLASAKMGAMYITCPACEGYGLVKTAEAAALAALRKVQTRSARGDFGRIRVGLPPDVAVWMLNHKRDDLRQIERRRNLRIDIDPQDRLLQHESEIETIPREKSAEPEAGAVAEHRSPAAPPSAEALASSTPAVPAPDDRLALRPADEVARPPDVPSRRRRRRRRRPAQDAAAPAGEPMTPGAEPRVVADRPPDLADREPRARSEAADAPDVDAQDPAAAGTRRRRRRRRRGRGTGGAPSGTGPPVETVEVVPRGVSSNELMPAATGRRGGRRGARGPTG